MKPGTNVLLTFGDSSGNPSRSEKAIADTPYYIVVTITTGVPEAHRIDGRMDRLKKKYFDGRRLERAEFHARVLLKHLLWQTKNIDIAHKKFEAVFDDIVEIVLDMDAIINVVIMEKRPIDEMTRLEDTTIKSWDYAAHMLQPVLLRSPPNTTNLTLLDTYDDATNRNVNEIIVQRLKPFINVGGFAGRTAMRPVFVNSRLSNLIQLVDMIAHIMTKVSRHEDAEGSFARRYALLEPKISCIRRGTVS